MDEQMKREYVRMKDTEKEKEKQIHKQTNKQTNKDVSFQKECTPVL